MVFSIQRHFLLNPIYDDLDGMLSDTAIGRLARQSAKNLIKGGKSMTAEQLWHPPPPQDPISAAFMPD